jgi:hypothetical protein
MTLIYDVNTFPELVAAINEQYPNLTFTDQHYNDWMWGGPLTDEAEAVVVAILGQEVFDSAEVCAREEGVLLIKLGLAIQPKHEQAFCKSILNFPEKWAGGI